MKKLLASIGIAFLVLLAPVLAGDLSASDFTNVVSTTNPGTPVTGSFKLINTGANTLTSIDTSAIAFTGAGTIDASKVTFNPDPIQSINSGANRVVSFTINVPAGQTPGHYVGMFTATDASGNNAVDIPVDLTVSNQPGIDVTQSSVVLSAQEGDETTTTITIKNTGNAPLDLSASSFTHSIDLIDNDGEQIALTFSPKFSSLAPGATGTVEINADVESGMDIGTYGGTVTVTSGSVSDTFTLDVKVQPEVCNDGPVGHVTVRIEDPDNNDEFAPGETMSISVKVDNNDNDDIDAVVEAFLYDVDEDDNVADAESDSVSIDSDDDDTIDLDLEIPADDSVTEDHEYVLYVKAYDDGNEDENCGEDQVDIDIQREKDDVRIDDVSVAPATLSCGESGEVSVRVVNAGSNKQNDVYIELKNAELGIDEKSSEFDLKDGESSSDNDAVRRFTIQIPEDARQKSYQLETNVIFNDGDDSNSDFATITVSGCGETDGDYPDVPETPDVASIEVVESQVTSSGNMFSIPVKVANQDMTTRTFNVELTNIEDWASSVSAKTITLRPGQSSTLYFYVTADENAQGKQSATINVNSNAGDVLASETVSINLGEAPAESSTGVVDFVKEHSTAFWIVGDIILLVLVVLFLKFIFAKRKK